MTGTIRATTPRIIGVPGSPDTGAVFAGALTVGHLTVAGKVTRVTRSLPTGRGHLTITGKSLVVASTGWQYTTITSLVSIGAPGVQTMYDSLDPSFGLVPSIGDVWRAPYFSTDGGSINIAVDARFEIGAPTSGFDSMVGVMYYNLINNVWYGPVTVTVIDPLLTLPIARGHMIWDGKDVMMQRQRLIVPGHLVVFGHLLRTDKTRALSSIGHLTLTGASMNLPRSMRINPAGHLVISGKTILRTARLTMQLTTIGHLTISGKVVRVTRGLGLSTIGHLTITGRTMSLALGVPLFVQPPGHLVLIGAELRMTKQLVFTAGHLVIHGRTVNMRSTGAIGRIDKPGVTQVRRRRNIISSQLEDA